MTERVVFVPGFPGSELHLREADGALGRRIFVPFPFTKMATLPATLREQLSGPDDLDPQDPDQVDPVGAGSPVKSLKFLAFDLSKQADHLYDILQECGVSGPRLSLVGWDWRRPVNDPAAQKDFGSAVRRAAAAGQPPIVIAHSTGGLLVRKALEDDPALATLIKMVVAFGVPWAGTLEPLAVMTRQRGFGITGAAKAQRLIARSWTAYDLLPRGKAGLTVNHAGDSIDITQSSHRHWIPGSIAASAHPRLDRTRSQSGLGFPKQRWDIDCPLINLVGWGFETTVLAQVESSGVVRFNPPQRVTGEAAWQGDGTVPLASADWIRSTPGGAEVTTLFIPIGAYQDSKGSRRPHSSLWRNPGGRSLLHHLLAGELREPFVYATVDWSDKVNPGANLVRLRFVLQQANGLPLTGGLLCLTNVVGQPDAVVDHNTGRGLLTVPRGAVPKIGGGKFRRLDAELHHPSLSAPMSTSMLIEP